MALRHHHPRIWTGSVVSVWASSWTIGATTFVIIGVEPWYRPQYVIPLIGMLLGNTLNGISLGLDRFGGTLDAHPDRVEALLALGVARWEAARSVG